MTLGFLLLKVPREYFVKTPQQCRFLEILTMLLNINTIVLNWTVMLAS